MFVHSGAKALYGSLSVWWCGFRVRRRVHARDDDGKDDNSQLDDERPRHHNSTTATLGVSTGGLCFAWDRIWLTRLP